MKIDNPADLPPLRQPLLQGKRALITGAAGGIGRPTARLFAAMGARVAALDIAPSVTDFARELGGQHSGIVVDVIDPAAAHAAVEKAAQALGGLDVVVTMAGLVHPGRVADLTDAQWSDTLAMHMTGTFNVCRAAIPSLRRAGGGSIVCMSSIAGERGGGLRGGGHYAAAKAGILGLSRAMARELAPDGIRVNAVCPGAVHTGKRDFQEMNAGFGDRIPMGRVGLAEEIARVFVFLASDLSTYVTGATIDANGGMHIH